MKDKIEIGDYVRSKFGEIKRVDKIFYNKKTSGIEEYGQIIEKRKESEGYTVVDAREIVKHSKNLIDLIEKGDFVNGEKVVGIDNVYNSEEKLIGKRIKTEYRTAQYAGLDNRYYLYERDIKTILTHEMYAKNCYEVEE